MSKVVYKRVPGWKIIRLVVSPRVKSPGFPISSDEGDQFYLSEREDNEWVEGGSWADVFRLFIPFLAYAWKSGQLKMTAKFMTVGTIGLVVNIVMVKELVSAGVDSKLAGIIGTVVTIFTNFLINDVWTFGEHRDKRPWVHRLLGYYGASAGSMVLQLGIYEVLIVVGVDVVVSVVLSVGVSYFVRLVFIRDKIYGTG